MLSQFLANNRDDLIRRCAAKVAERPRRVATPEQLKNGIPMFLDQLRRTLEAEEGTDAQSFKFSGASGGDSAAPSEMGTSAAAHGKQLLTLEFTVDQVVHDYGDLCQAITDLAVERDAPFKVDEFRTLNRCLDNAIADAVTEFSAQRDAVLTFQRNAEASERVGYLAHEMRNALGTATLATAALETGNLPMSGATGSVLKRSHAAMSRLISHALAEVRQAAGNADVPEVFTVAAFIHDAQAASALDAQARGCGFQCFVVDPSLEIMAHRAMLQAALANLLQNAFKFSQPHTTVSLRAYADEGYVLIDVQDHCGGLPRGGAERMFTPFAQRSEDKSGLGLGLSIARNTVEAQGGTLSVRDIPGVGCVFTIRLPHHGASPAIDRRCFVGREPLRSGAAWRDPERSQPTKTQLSVRDGRERKASGTSGETGSKPPAPPPERLGAGAKQSVVVPDQGGDMGAMMRAHDWSSSPLGEPAGWPSALKTIMGLVLNSNFPMFVAWGSELALLYNDAYAGVLEDKHPLALGRPLRTVWSDAWSRLDPMVQRALGGYSDFYADQPFTMHRNGAVEEAWFTFSYAPIQDDQGQTAGVYCVCMETTDRVLSHRRQIDDHQRFRSLFQKAPGIVAVICEPNHTFEFANDAYLRLVGQRELIGKTVIDALPEVAAQGFVKLLDDVYQSGEPYFGRGVAICLQRSADSPSLEERFVDFVYQPIPNEHGKTGGIFVEGSDVTDRVLAEKALREGERRKDEFLSMLAHELRNPLAPISTAAELLKVPGIGAEMVQHAGDVVARQAAHLTGLVNDLLDVSRVTRGLVQIGDEAVDVLGAVGDAIEQTQAAMRQKSIHFSAHLAPSPLYVKGDRMRLVQVFSNILDNAAKYTAEKGQVSLRLQAEELTLEVAVTDDGAGISPDLLPHLFELFAQGSRTPDRSQGGLGLGLTLVKSLVSLHEGTVVARSAGVGKGSEFVVRLPRIQMQDQTKTPEPSLGESQRKLNLMIVDDNADAAETLSKLLQTMGHRVSVAYTGADALELARESAPELLFLDIGMPHIDGYELVRRLRLLPETSTSTMVALTGYGKQADMQKALQAGFDRHFVKPVLLKDLVEVISEQTRHRGSAPETAH